METYITPTPRPISRGTEIIWYIAGLLEILLLFRFALKLFGANPSAGFSQFIYNLSYPFVAPFLNVFRVTYTQGSIFEWTTLLAMFVYYLITLAIIRLFLMSQGVTTTATTRTEVIEEI